MESPQNRQPKRKRSDDSVKRRALKAQKYKRIAEIRTILGMDRKASPLEVLNAGAGVFSVVVAGLVIHHPRCF